MNVTIPDKKILPFHQADAGPSDRVIEGEAEQRSGWPAVGGSSLLFAFGILLSLPLCE